MTPLELKDKRNRTREGENYTYFNVFVSSNTISGFGAHATFISFHTQVFFYFSRCHCEIIICCCRPRNPNSPYTVPPSISRGASSSYFLFFPATISINPECFCSVAGRLRQSVGAPLRLSGPAPFLSWHSATDKAISISASE